MLRVIIAEKPSVARTIAHVLGICGTQDGYIGNVTEAGTVVTWAIGHLTTLALPEQYGFTGFRRENLPILPKPFQLVPRQAKQGKEYRSEPGALKQLNVIKELFDKCDEIIVATDAGREGELIFRMIFKYLKCNKPFKRLWISSLTDKAIKEGFEKLKNGSEFDNLYQSARSRCEADWLVGINASQALSIVAGSGVYSLGRVQTPTLAMVCGRFLENRNFQPQTYFQVQTVQEAESIEFKMLSEEKFTEKEQAQEIQNCIRGAKMEIIEADTKLVREAPPLLYDLTGLQKDANKRLNFSADETLSIAQALYEKKFITYPRTGSRYIGEDVWDEIPTLLEVLTAYPPLKEYARSLQKTTLNRKCVNDVKVTDHHALLVTDNTPSGLSKKEESVYKLIATRLLETLSEACEKEVTHITGLAREHRFTAHGTEIIKPGWRMMRGLFDPEQQENNDNPDQHLPCLDKGDTLKISSAILLEKQTKPKPLHTEATLLSAMEKASNEIENENGRNTIKEYGIGTPATRASIIETLFSRGYIERQKKSLIPTSKGLKVYEAVKNKRIADVAMTSAWEKALSDIESGKMVSETFDKSIAVYARQITEELLALDFPKDNVAVLKCPKCQQKTVKLLDKVAKCTDRGCQWLLFRNICGRILSEDDVRMILASGKSSLIRGMTSRKNKKFDAFIVLKEDGSTAFEFPSTFRPAKKRGKHGEK